MLLNPYRFGPPPAPTDLVRAMFAANEQGVWYDPSDFSTMFQDSAGTTPVTAVGQRVGLILDKRLGIPVLGPDLVDTMNTTAAWIVRGSNTKEQDGDAVKVTYGNNVTGAFSALLRTEGLSADVESNTWYEAHFQVKVSAGAAVAVVIYNTSVAATTGNITSTEFVDKTLRFLSGGLTLAFEFDGMGAGESVWIRGITIQKLPGNHAYEREGIWRPLLQQDETGLYYLDFDGSDYNLSTNFVDFTGTDKVTVWAGVRKESAAAWAVVCELSPSSATNNSAFTLYAPSNNGLADYGWRSKGTVASTIASAAVFASPHKAVLTGIGDISGDSAILRVNGAQVASASTDQGTGNFGNYELNIGSRDGIYSPLNGRIYQLIVRGAASNAGQIAAGEAYVNSKTGAY